MTIKIAKTAAAGDFSGAMTDISFLLIIFFLVTAVFMSNKGILLHLPQKDQQPRHLRKDEIIAVELHEGGKYLVNGAEADTRELLIEQLRKGASVLQEPVLVLHVYDAAGYQQVLTLLETAKDCGISTFSIQYMESEPKGLSIGASAE